MNCPECESIMVIDDWNGWRWTCFRCGHVDRRATDEEIEAKENEYRRYYVGRARTIERSKE